LTNSSGGPSIARDLAPLGTGLHFTLHAHRNVGTVTLAPRASGGGG